MDEQQQNSTAAAEPARPFIPPTVGRVVHYFPYQHPLKKDPLAATISAVNPDGTINLGFLTPYGDPRTAQNVVLLQDREQQHNGDYYVEEAARWMGYQIGQARSDTSGRVAELEARVEQLEDQIAQFFADSVLAAGPLTGTNLSDTPDGEAIGSTVEITDSADAEVTRAGAVVDAASPNDAATESTHT